MIGWEEYQATANERDYLRLLKTVHNGGIPREDRTGTGTRSLFSPETVAYDLRRGFPALTTKRLAWKACVAELLWFISGDTNVKSLQDRGCKIWNEWSREGGELGPIYGSQWRSWETVDTSGEAPMTREIDQLADVIEQIKTNPTSRRLVVSAWNVGDLEDMALPPCHAFFQFYVDGDDLDLKLTQRSADMFLGVPFNVASYSLLLHIVAHLTGKTPRRFYHSLGDAHVYNNHQKQVVEQLSRKPFPSPKLQFSERALAATHINDFALGKLEPEDFTLVGYEHHPAIKAEVSV